MKDASASAFDARLIYMTVGSREEALRLAEVAVREKLAACANIMPQVSSIYEWQGVIRCDEEVVVILKTCQERVTVLTERLLELHSYDCPCVVSVPILSGNEPFLAWVKAQSSPPAD